MPDRDLRLEAEDLKDAVKDLTTAVSEQAARGKVNRALIMILGLSFALGVVLGIVVWRVALSAQHANSTANQNYQTSVATCLAGNSFRSGELALWQFLIDSSRRANPHPTPAQAKVLDDWQRKVNDTFAPRDCAHLPTSPATPSTAPLPQ